MNSKKLVLEIKKELRKAVEPGFVEQVRHFFKEPVKPIGIRRPVTRKIVGKFYKKHKEKLSFQDFISLSETLLKTGILEEGDAALFLIAKEKKNYSKQTFFVFETWLKKYIHNWAHVDTLCPEPVGYLIEKYPELYPKILSWTKSKNRWLRRASIVSFTLIARKKDYSKQVVELCTQMLDDKDDLIHKACGWTLREAAKANKKPVIAFLRKNKLKMPRTMLRYAIERFSEKEKKELMKK